MDSSLTFQAKFVSKKLSKIRWKPTNEQIVEHSTLIVTGSWDEEDSQNSIDLWTVDPTSLLIEASEVNRSGSFEGDLDVPIHLHSFPHAGDVTDLLFVSNDLFLASSSTGDVTLLKCDSSSHKLSVRNVWKDLHHFSTGSPSPCTAVASRERVFASAGEDGRINVVNMDAGGPRAISSIENADSTSIADICFLKQTEVATVNAIGQFKIWDLRQSTKDPAQIHVLGVVSGCPVALRCLDQHPTQPHIVATGGQNGELYIWDMRQNKTPATLVTCHQSDIWEVRFHPTFPNSLFTCSQDGSIFQWGNSKTQPDLFGHNTLSSRKTLGLNSMPTSVKKPNVMSKGQSSPFEVASDAETSSWPTDEAVAGDRLVVRNLMPNHDVPVNSLDVIGSTLIAGTDGEEILMINKLDVF